MKMIPLVLTVVVAICANLRAKDDPEAAPAPLPNFDKRRDAQPDVSIEAGAKWLPR